MVDYGSLFVAEYCISMGHFVKWYLYLKEVLNTHAQLYVLEEPVGDKPKFFCKR